ncbi:MAG: ATPase domain-containing protein, partial [Longimicrobiales bacterium]
MNDKTKRSGGTTSTLASTGIPGLDTVMGGGLPRNHAYLIQGRHGSGKTTLALQFCMAGAREGETALYLSTCESESEIREVAASHGWSLEGVTLHYHDPRSSFPEGDGQSVFRPAEVELPQTIQALLQVIQEVDPHRLVIDSLSEIRLLSPEGRWFRRQVLALKEDLARRQCTTFFCDDRLTPDQPVHSIVHGVIDLEQLTREYGPDRRRVRIAKLRGTSFASGFHDFRIHTGGLEVYPRLAAAKDRPGHVPEVISTGLEELDTLFGGGLDLGTATLMLGPSGTGKSTLACQIAAASAQRGEAAA